MKEILKNIKNHLWRLCHGTDEYCCNGYSVAMASPLRRCFSFIFDYMLLMILLSAMGGFVLLKHMPNPQEQNIEIEISTEGVQEKNTVPADKILNPSVIKDLDYKDVIKILQENKLFSYTMLILPLLYNILCLMIRGNATVGQRLFKLSVVSLKNNKLNPADIINRSIFQYVCFLSPILLGLLIFAPVLTTKNQITFYDFFTGTRVIQIKKVNNNEN